MVYQNLLNSITTGYLNQEHPSNKNLQPQLVLNDKTKQKKVLSTLINELKSCDYFEFSVAFLTTGGVAVLTNTLDELFEKGIRGRIIVSKYLNFTQPEALRRLLRYTNIELRIDETNSFHAKCYIFKKEQHYTVIIGSSNLTDNALSKNYEFNLKINSLNNSLLINDILNEQQSIVNQSVIVDLDFINIYEKQYQAIKNVHKTFNNQLEQINNISIKPNSMQVEALANLNNLRGDGVQKALIISATGTGKTFLSAFDVKSFQPNRILFLVHRSTIANNSLKSYKKVIENDSKSYGVFDGIQKQLDADYLFSTIQTMSRESNLKLFKKDHFDYIIIDETHRATAKSYGKILEHFTPKFLLGMTATPERTDGEDIFKLFDHNIAYEIRLNDALDANLLTTFHYYGITDLEIDGEAIDDKTNFNRLVCDQRVQHIINKIQHYKTDNGEYRGLVFCSRVEEAEFLALEFKQNGYNSIALSGKNNENEREKAMNSLESNDKNRLEFIFTVDIFNEGVDIPKVNLIILLRSTQSAIVFIQQLGRGLRKAEDKSYVTVLDFIGNYDNNYLIPIALFGDTSYNKDHIRKSMSEGSNLIPGASTIDFDTITKQRIFESLNKTNISKKRDLTADYKLLSFKLGHRPSMLDFIKHGSRDPYSYILEYKSFYNAVKAIENDSTLNLSKDETKILEYFDKEINNSIRIIETYILFLLLENNNSIDLSYLEKSFKNFFKFNINRNDILSAIKNINFDFVTRKFQGKNITYCNSDYLNDKSLYKVIKIEENLIKLSPKYIGLLTINQFKTFFYNSIQCALYVYKLKLKNGNYQVENGFILYEKYSRKDVFRILNWSSNPIAQNVGGYLISEDKSLCPVFVNYHKKDDISDSTKYDDGFIDNQTFKWMSKSGRNLLSNDVKAIYDYIENKMSLFLFIKKENDEGTFFYFMGMMTPDKSSFEETKLPSLDSNEKKVVKLNFNLTTPVKESLYNYIINR